MSDPEVVSSIVPRLEHDGYRLEVLDGEKYKTPVINKCATYAMLLHLACFAFMIASKLYMPGKLTSNAMSIKILLNFITVPFQIFIIFELEFGREKLRFKIKEESCEDKLIISHGGPICVSKNWGNVQQWVWIELLTFYFNIFTLMLFLLHSLFTSANKRRKSKAFGTRRVDDMNRTYTNSS